MSFRPLLLVLIPTLVFGFSGGSATGFTFMKIGVGARPMAMGGAFTAVADDANALFWNPAGLAMTRNYDANITFMNVLQSADYTCGGLTIPLGPRFGAGAAIGYLGTTDTRRNELGEELGTFGLSDLAVGPGLGWRPLRGLGFGIGARYVSSRIDTFRASTVSIDGGMMYRPFPFLTLGASLLHLGPPRRFISKWEYPPVNLRFGTALRADYSTGHFLLASDVSLYPNLSPMICFGAEAYLRTAGTGAPGDTIRGQGFCLRGGYRTGLGQEAQSGWSLGVGYEYGLVSWLVFGVDVVYSFCGLPGDTERASAYIRFMPDMLMRDFR